MCICAFIRYLSKWFAIGHRLHNYCKLRRRVCLQTRDGVTSVLYRSKYCLAMNTVFDRVMNVLICIATACIQPQTVGQICSSAVPGQRYSYNPTTRSCTAFTYQGCGANGNNFFSAQACEEFCMPGTLVAVLWKFTHMVLFLFI